MMYILQIALAALALAICIFLVITLVKSRPLIQKVNNIIMEAKVEDMKINYNKIMYVIILLLAATLVLTAVNVYVYTTRELESPAIQNESNQTVTVNVNSDSDSSRLDLNTATRKELEALPGVGSVLAGRIIAARPFYSVEQLKNIEGIGETTYVKLRGLVEIVGHDN